LAVEVLRAGRSQTTVDVSLEQDGPSGPQLRVRTQVTLGVLGDQAVAEADDAAMPDGPGPEAWAAMSTTAPELAELVPALHKRVEMRLSPELGMFEGRTGGPPVIDGWMRSADDRPVDSLALLVFSDLFPPSIYEQIGFWQTSVPTVQLTTHLFGRPAPGWIRGRSRTRVRAGSLLDQDMDLWDADGQVVATSRQLALIRSSDDGDTATPGSG
jgi:acyl-CoA thioesterase